MATLGYMPSMSYCRHENAAAELSLVWELWDDWSEDESNEYEARARRSIVRLVREMHEQFALDGAYEADDAVNA